MQWVPCARKRRGDLGVKGLRRRI